MISDKNEDEKKPPASVETVESKPTKQKKRRLYKHDKRWSKKKQKDKPIENSWAEYFKFMEANFKKKTIKNHLI